MEQEDDIIIGFVHIFVPLQSQINLHIIEI